MNPILDFTIRLLVALVLGGLIGIEREYRSKEAGFRTHFLVALGSALFCIVSQFGFSEDLKDSSRVAAQVVSGIGFLGAGTIIFQRNVVRGLTTAAGLWVTAAIGLACGSGLYWVAIAATLIVLFGLEVLNAFVPQVGTATIILEFTATSKQSIKRVIEQMKHDKLEIYSYELQERKEDTGEKYLVNLEMKVKRGNYVNHLLDYMEEFEGVTISSIE